MARMLPQIYRTFVFAQIDCAGGIGLSCLLELIARIYRTFVLNIDEPAGVAIPINGGTPRRLCANYCFATRSANGSSFGKSPGNLRVLGRNFVARFPGAILKKDLKCLLL
jgi:hypothetical protein